jgi:hypothetical protein
MKHQTGARTGRARPVEQQDEYEHGVLMVRARGPCSIGHARTPSRAARSSKTALVSRFGSRATAVLPIAREHVPVETVAEARRELERTHADSVLAFGGGTPIGLGKVLALLGRVRLMAVPTTYSGSEMTPVYGMTEAGEKRTGRDERVRPALVVYDVGLTLGLPFDVVAWHGNHAPFTYDLSLFSAMGSVTFDHPDPSILTVLTAPLDDHGRAVADLVVFPGRWEVLEHSFRPPFMHRNAASEINMVIRTPSPEGGYEKGCIVVSPLLTSHGVSTKTYDEVLSLPEDFQEPPRRLPDELLWVMFESALPFRSTAWARETPLVDRQFLDQFAGMRRRFDPSRP